MARVIHRDIPLSLTAEGDIGPQELQAWDPGVRAPWWSGGLPPCTWVGQPAFPRNMPWLLLTPLATA